MGGTLPLLAAWLQHLHADAGRRSARFYSVNSLGAVTGSALAAFWLVQSFGMVATLQMTAAVNVLIGATAVVLGRGSLPTATVEPPPDHGPEAAGAGTLRWAGWIVASTGGVSMGLEVLASRSLALIFGSSLQSFATVLIAFILGIGLGSAWVASVRRSGKSCERLVVVLLCTAAAWVALLVLNIEKWVDFYRLSRIGLAPNMVGYVYHLLLTSGIALVVLGVPAALIGAVLPLLMRAVSHEGSTLGRRVGALLTWNTLGAVGGVLLTGFVLMPLAGLRSSFLVLSMGLSAMGLLIAWRSGWRLRVGLPAVILVSTAGCLGLGGQGWREVMSSGIFRVREEVYHPNLMKIRKEQTDLLFYKDAPDATVSVEQAKAVVVPESLGLHINGKADAGTDLDLSNQLLLAHLPLLVKPEAKDVFVLGMGSGMTAGAALAYPLDRVVIGENCKPVVEAARFFEGWNYHVLDDPRVRVQYGDARTTLKLSPELFDVIITEPSNPWTVGVGSVFSRDFYELAASRLKPGGLIAQWFHLYETDDFVVEMVLRTFSSTFPHVEIWDTGSGDMVILGALQPWPTGPEVFRRGFEIERVRLDMWMIDIRSPETLMSRQLASQRTAFAIPAEGPIQSDRFPKLEYAAPRAFYRNDRSRLLDRFDERTWQQLLAPPEKRATLASLPMAQIQLVLSAFSTINGELSGCVFGNPASANVPCAFQVRTPHPAPNMSGTPVDLAVQSFAAGDLVRAEQLAALALQATPDDPMAKYLQRVIEREKQVRSVQVSGNE